MNNSNKYAVKKLIYKLYLWLVFDLAKELCTKLAHNAFEMVLNGSFS